MTVDEMLEEIARDTEAAHVPTATEVETFSGQYVDTSKPDPLTINLVDIAHALSQTCRYGGHCQAFQSVAEHAVFVSIRLERQGHGRGKQLAGLHHDDSEAYLGDIPRPLKPLLGKAYERLTDRMDRAVIAALGLADFGGADFHSEEVKDADNFALVVEARHLLPSKGLHWFNGDQGAAAWGIKDSLPSRIVTPDYWHGGLAPTAARDMFIERHRALTT